MSIGAATAAKLLCELSGWKLSNLELHKILYVAQMIHLGLHGKDDPLIREKFEAWEYGPVIPSLYHRLKAFGSGPVGNVFHSINEGIGESEKQSIILAWEALKNKRPSELIAITHHPKGAWQKHFKPFERGNVIANEDILEEYRMRVNERR